MSLSIETKLRDIESANWSKSGNAGQGWVSFKAVRAQRGTREHNALDFGSNLKDLIGEENFRLTNEEDIKAKGSFDRTEILTFEVEITEAALSKIESHQPSFLRSR